MCANDIATMGAQPLFFLDYYATGALDVDACASLVEGVADGCAKSGCALSGGETAEMPGLYGAGDFDVAGFCVGAVRKRDLLPRTSSMQAGDVLIGVSSSGVHANGFSLVRKALAKFAKQQNTSISALLDAPASSVGAGGDESLASVLLAPTRLYASMMAAVGFLVQEAFQPPIREALEWIQEFRQAQPPSGKMMIFLVGRPLRTWLWLGWRGIRHHPFLRPQQQQ